ncbi:hypothetical protein Ahy_B02g059120 [Arachis hypogaea]|uniref:SWIM-type domain-containing protein n=1 Tax=Arachis hypogaea TaxID=3818 RepID=A0A445AG70_ARAHY|nr:hypothetical protein Ahy_B02g059120 [Arachis hypogaea]
MASNNPYIVVLVYPNGRMFNGDNGVTFECEDPILFRTQRVNTLSDLKSLILSKLGGTVAREIGRVAYRLLASMGDEHVRVMFNIHGRIMAEQVMEMSVEVGHSGGGPSVHSTYVQDNRPLAPPPIHVAVPVDEAEEGEEESDEDYVADSGDSKSFDGEDENDCVPETPVPTAPRHVLPPHLSIPALSAVSSHYHGLDLDAMHERTPFLDTERRSHSSLLDAAQRLLAVIEKNREGIPKMRVTHCDRRASVFVVEELEPFERWGGGSFRVRLSDGTCDCRLFQSLHYPCRHALAWSAAASIEWAPYMHPVY